MKVYNFQKTDLAALQFVLKKEHKNEETQVTFCSVNSDAKLIFEINDIVFESQDLISTDDNLVNFIQNVKDKCIDTMINTSNFFDDDSFTKEEISSALHSGLVCSEVEERIHLKLNVDSAKFIDYFGNSLESHNGLCGHCIVSLEGLNFFENTITVVWKLIVFKESGKDPNSDKQEIVQETKRKFFK